MISVVKCLLNKSRSNDIINSKHDNLPVEANQYHAEHEIAKEDTSYNAVVNDVLTTTCETMKQYNYSRSSQKKKNEPGYRGLLFKTISFCLLFNFSVSTASSNECNIISNTQGKVTSCNDETCQEKFVTVANMKPFETLCLGNSKNQITHTIKIL